MDSENDHRTRRSWVMWGTAGVLLAAGASVGVWYFLEHRKKTAETAATPKDAPCGGCPGAGAANAMQQIHDTAIAGNSTFVDTFQPGRIDRAVEGGIDAFMGSNTIQVSFGDSTIQPPAGSGTFSMMTSAKPSKLVSMGENASADIDPAAMYAHGFTQQAKLSGSDQIPVGLSMNTQSPGLQISIASTPQPILTTPGAQFNPRDKLETGEITPSISRVAASDQVQMFENASMNRNSDFIAPTSYAPSTRINTGNVSTGRHGVHFGMM